MKRNKFMEWIWHPVLFACFTVLSLFAYNQGEVLFSVIIRPLILIILLSLILLGGYRLLVKEWHLAGLLTTWSLFLFSTYGHFHNYLKQLGWGASIARHRYLVSLWALLFISGAFFLYRKAKRSVSLTKILNLSTFSLVVLSVITMVHYEIINSRAVKSIKREVVEDEISLSVPDNPPDIYYILLDGYSRSDVLAERFGFDNSYFVEDLEELGFYIANCSRSNYHSTQITLPTLLNMDYIDQLVEDLPRDGDYSSVPVEHLTKNNKVMQLFKSMGYKTVAFETSFYWSHFTEADYYFKPLEKSVATVRLSALEEMYLDTTILKALLDWYLNLSDQFSKTPIMPRETHYIRINFILDKLTTINEIDPPTFTFAHMIIPHAPFIFTEEGLITDLNLYSDQYERGEKGMSGYINNVRFINKEIPSVVSEILRQSKNEPVIIIQSDHGSKFFDRSMNFTAIYFPHGGDRVLYESLTPVNTFRLVFNQYFNAELPLLPDKSYLSGTGPFDLHLVEETYSDCKAE